MIEVGVIDLSADGRRKLGALLERWSWVSSEAEGVHLPRLSLRLLSPEEMRFHGGLDLCVVGPEMVSCDVMLVSSLRRQVPEVPLLCILDNRTRSFATIEQLIRAQVDDVMVDSASGDEFFRRVILLGRRRTIQRKGRVVIVNAARGGVGGTFVAAALAEKLVGEGKKVCLVDTDTFSQDLSRFLQCRPFVNEPLKLILDNQRIPTAETIAECVFRVWQDEENFFCMTPPAASDQLSLDRSTGLRSFLAVLDGLKLSHDYTVIDGSALPASARQAVYQIADVISLVMNRDPAGAYANRQALSIINGYARKDACIALVVNDTSRSFSVPVSFLEQEILPSRERLVSIFEVPYSRRAGGWACSGSTPATFLPKVFGDLGAFVVEQGEVDASDRSKGRIRGFIDTCLSGFKNRRKKRGDINSPPKQSAAFEDGERAFPPARRRGRDEIEESRIEGAVGEENLVSPPTLNGCM